MSTETEPKSDEEIRVKIGEFCGWRKIEFYEDHRAPSYWCGLPPDSVGVDADGEWTLVRQIYSKPLPDYLGSLDAIATAEAKLTEEQRPFFADHLNKLTRIAYVNHKHWSGYAHHATARMRCIALLQTIEEKGQRQ